MTDVQPKAKQFYMSTLTQILHTFSASHNSCHCVSRQKKNKKYY